MPSDGSASAYPSRAGLDALIACYLTLSGPDGVPLVEELFFQKPKDVTTENYADVYAELLAEGATEMRFGDDLPPTIVDFQRLPEDDELESSSHCKIRSRSPLRGPGNASSFVAKWRESTADSRPTLSVSVRRAI